MNCDHAFDLMTDPALDECAELHSHLAECPRCRQMYETLSPALGLFSSAGSADVGRPMTDDGTVAAGGVEIAQRIAVRLAHEPPAPVAEPRLRRPLQAWACVLAGGLVLISAIGLSAMYSAAVPAAPAGERCTWQHRETVGADLRAEVVVLSCVACHAGRQELRRGSTSMLPSRWTDWTVPALAEIEPVLSFDDPAWLQWAIWPTERAAHS